MAWRERDKCGKCNGLLVSYEDFLNHIIIMADTGLMMVCRASEMYQVPTPDGI
jgi:hypothetical protein